MTTLVPALSRAILDVNVGFGVHASTEGVTAVGVGTIVALILLSAFFASSEIALFSLANHRVDALVAEGHVNAETVAALKEDPHRLLVTILVGNNVVNIAMSSIATGLLGLYLSGGQAVIVATFGITSIVLLFGESAPKSYAIENTESWALRVARPLKFAEYALYPLVVTFDRLTRIVNRLVGSQAAIETPYVTRTELQEMIETGRRHGVIEEGEHEMLRDILRLRNRIAREIMTPRLDVVAVSADAGIEDAIDSCIEHGRQRLPVYEETLDEVVGVVVLADLVDARREHGPDTDVSDTVRSTLQVPGTKEVDELLAEMREERVELAIVVDEFGTMEGLITMEDIVEEIVGEILERGESAPIELLGDDRAIVQGDVTVEEVNDALDVELPADEGFETIAGFVLARAGRLVEEGETIEYDGVAVTVEEVEDSRLLWASVERRSDAVPDERDEGTDGIGRIDPTEDPEP